MIQVLGFMAGTSLDGVDAALIDTDGETLGASSASSASGTCLHIPYAEKTRRAIEDAIDSVRTDIKSDVITRAARLVLDAHVEAFRALGARPQLIGFHGQTILHKPREARTIQIGDGAALARACLCDVVSDFRKADMQNGGEGAPLAPLYHQALLRKSKVARPACVLNLGGVANVTYSGDDDTLIAFDTGPGNGLLDLWAEKHTGAPIDEDGKLAANGRVDESALAALLAHPFFDRAPPKSADRYDFTYTDAENLSPEDGAATLTALTAQSIARAARHFPSAPQVWIATGGGRHNPTLMKALGSALPGKLLSADALGWRGDMLEAEAFAYLAARAQKGLPLTLPTTTGVSAPLTGGILHKA